jgi:hypothetical protein
MKDSSVVVAGAAIRMMDCMAHRGGFDASLRGTFQIPRMPQAFPAHFFHVIVKDDLIDVAVVDPPVSPDKSQAIDCTGFIHTRMNDGWSFGTQKLDQRWHERWCWLS